MKETYNALLHRAIEHGHQLTDELVTLLRKEAEYIDGVEDMPEGEPEQVPAVDPRKSIHNDYLICLEDGKKMKLLKRYLKQKYDMTPDEYRAKWKLPFDYPMVAPGYAEKRSNLAKAIGLGNNNKKAEI